ncbi:MULTISPECIES: 2-isopropylmalate synthase [unclassified Methanoregula]|uniref:2-isopropylmalate synthase n=1 Tax=unclassified Methanoregula TaxID=2649730 RepID=UPI0009CF6C60|nr:MULTISPECIES: 2-isopropylmalate synthase [unclassified Methanoregula]OPX65520.1 MAG: 2-isopropylmalate synthase [Methanoregula sp. PtaB.Bin085]OPY35800.1 MAG: 2-isopropylmalate synthase [Methanoregula sp. PtaU1.Bin006]
MLRGIVFFTDSEAREEVTVFDTTLRDGEQTPGIAFTFEQKLQIARQLSDIGVHAIEAGFPASSKAEKETVTAIKKLGLESVICGLARSTKNDVDTCLECGVDMVHVFIPTSDIQRENTINKTRKEVLGITADIVGHVRRHKDLCMFSAMDATRTDWDYLIEVFRTAADAGATIINVPDTVGVISPSAMKMLVRRINKEVRCPIDVHCHNDFGLAVANTIAAVEAGASQVQVTVNGLGERAGNADLAQTVMIMESMYRIKTGIEKSRLVETSRLISRFSGITIPPTQPVVGENVFSHESGIHSHGVIKNAATFEPGIMTPEMVGHRRRLTLGKHVGRHAVRQMLTDVHIDPTDQQLDAIIEKVKAIASRGKRVTDADLYEIAETEMGIELDKKAFDLVDIAIMTGNHAIPTASVRAKVNGKEHVFSAVGNGPVDAALKAILGITPSKLQLKEFNIEAISGGSDAMCHVTIAVEDEHGRIFDAAGSGDDIVLSSVEAMVNAVNLINRA